MQGVETLETDQQHIAKQKRRKYEGRAGVRSLPAASGSDASATGELLWCKHRRAPGSPLRTGDVNWPLVYNQLSVDHDGLYVYDIDYNFP